MRTTVIIQDLKCDNCRHLVVEAFNTFEEISNLVTNALVGSLSFDYTTHNVLEGLRLYLKEIGHPITKDPNIISNTSESIINTSLDSKK